MAKKLLARGQATINTLQDSYTLTVSINNYVFTSEANGTIRNAVTITSFVKATLDNKEFTDFTIGVITKPAGFSSITVNNTYKSITFSILANTTNLADNGVIMIPVIIKGITYSLSFVWAKSRSGQSGVNGNDGYTIKSSRQSCVISTDKDGKIHTEVKTSTIISALKGKTVVTPVIGTLPTIAGCVLSKSGSTITITFNIGTSLAESGTIDIPITINGLAFGVSFSYAKARSGANGNTGAAGVDANMLDWVKEWNTNKTLINTSTVITPKLFAGTKNSNGTLTGIAIGHFALSTLNASGSIITETVNGICGFKDGYKTFFVDSTGNVQLGRNNQFIKYNSVTGKIEFGSDVTMNWVNAINTTKTEVINSAASTAQTKADAAKNAAIAAAATDAANKVNAIKIGGRNYIRNSAFTSNLTGVSADGTTVSIDTATLYNNYRTLKVLQNTACTDSNAATQRTYFNVINGKICTPASFSMYVKGSVASVMKIRIGGSGIRTVNITTSWQRVVLENITPTSAVVLFGFQTVGTYWCALPMLVEGSKTADWIPAPEDVDSSVAAAKKAGTDAKLVADAITSKANTEGWATKLTYIGSTGIFTGTLSANTVNAVRINASQITIGTIDAARINVAALKTSLITAGNIEALTLNVTKGKIGGWSLDADSIFRGTKNNSSGAYTGTAGSVCIGSNGIRGFKWRLDATGAGAVAGGNISWDAAGNVTFGSSVVLNWTNAATAAAGNALDAAKSYANTKKTEAINSAATDATNKVNALQIGGRNFYKKSTSITSLINSPTVQKEESADSRNGFKLTGKKDLTCAIRINNIITRNGSYVVSFLGKSNGTSTPNFNVCDIACSGNAQFTTSWKKFELKVNVSNYTDAVYHFLDIENLGWLYYWLKDFKIEEGTKATGWSPAPEDTDSSIKTVSDKADGTITALGGTSFPKLTHISGTGIYTGTLTASQVNAVAINAGSITTGTLSADRIGSKAITAAKIAAGTITAAEINVASIQASVVTANAVNGLTCTFNKGTIAGWNINANQIFKNNVYLGSDGSIYNGTKWKLGNDGSGQIANGNISWNAAGAVTFGTSVSLQWKNDIESAKTTNYGYRYYKKIVVNGESGKYYPIVFKGGDQTIKRDILIRRGYSEQAPTDWDNKSTTHKGGLSLLLKVNFGGWGGASYSWDIYELSEVYSRMFAGAAYCGNYCMFAVYLRGGGDGGAVYHLYSDQPIESATYSPSPIPPAPQIAYNSDRIFQSGTSTANAPAPRTLTAAVEEEIRYHRFIGLAQGNDTTLKAHPLTYIGSTGIYTGTLTANQVNAVAINASSITTGTLSADRIAAGSISSTKLDATSIKANIINVGYINGLTCAFTKGSIGGWTITSNSISGGQIVLDKANKRVVVYGASSGPTSGQRVQIYHNSNTDFGLYTTDSKGTVVVQLGSNNKIAGWTINPTQIYKNNVYLGSDGSITNGTKWKLGNDGSGQIANGNISWNAAGTVTFGSSVSLNWTNAATNALNSAKNYADTKKTEAVSVAATDATAKANAAKELALATAFGKMIYRDPEFRNGNNGINVYNNSGNGTVTITRTGLSSAPNDSKMVLEIKTTGTASPDNGGFFFGTTCSNRKVFISKIIAKIPVGRNIQWASNSIGTSGSSKWLTPNAGTGDWAEYVYKVTCGTSNFSSTNFFYLDGVQGTSAAPIIWQVAYATVFDTTSSERYTTTIDANGIYTGTVRAGQMLIDSALVVGGSSYNGSISVRDSGNNIMATLDRSGITAVAGKIGGWNINSGSIYACAPAGGHRVFITSSGYLYNDDGTQDFWGLRADGSATFGYGKILFDNDGSGYVANKNIKWDSKGNVEVKGNITANSGLIAGFTISGNKLINTAADSSIMFSSLMGNASMTINSSSALLSLRADSARTGIYLQTYAAGARGIYIVANAGSKFAIESYGPVLLGQRISEKWNVPGVLYIGCKFNAGDNTSFGKIWGEGVSVTSCYFLGNGKYRFYHNLNHTNYTVIAQGCQNERYYGFFRLLERNTNNFVIQNVGSKGGGDGSPFDFTIMGRNVW